ncbi:iron complex transport system ATP-binding protein [Sphingomonas laterariae]|uniref:Iron complex transport system ATP-binding protein n=1 Tax=Edaphosphingomonas laterariae TaxID=861865 RepID=A0A239HWJ3_9SPHN|nr:ABC transporter ATP-binding protein [Sphingomonas laterariae]SNS85621.1 iron complex transport system ATP-binding protein [Sphingomonas laterariae]
MVTIATQGLSVALGRRPVLHDVDTRLEPGALIGVIGPNGAGKSTLVRALLGLVPATSGGVAIDGVPVAAIRRADLARRIAYLPQGQTLHWPLTVERLVALGRLPHLAPFSRIGAADLAAIDRAIAQADIGHLRGRVATELSGGERARVLLARALAVEADALIADEPLAALDPGHQLEVMALLRVQAEAGALVVAVLHDLTLAARHCDRLLLLHEGRLVADGPPDTVLTAERMAEIYGVRAWIGRLEGRRLVVPLDHHG